MIDINLLLEARVNFIETLLSDVFDLLLVAYPKVSDQFHEVLLDSLCKKRENLFKRCVHFILWFVFAVLLQGFDGIIQLFLFDVDDNLFGAAYMILPISRIILCKLR